MSAFDETLANELNKAHLIILWFRQENPDWRPAVIATASQEIGKVLDEAEERGFNFD